MKTVFGIFWRDIRALLRNPVALLVVGALLILPGLYAWYCIVANWDPYANTGAMPVAIVNQDKGATSSLAGEVDIGGQVVDKLKDNDSIDWRFYDDEEQALKDVAELKCYAAIVLPEDLSANVVGIFEGSEKEPTIYYYPNEKKNAVATKVTDSAAQTLVKGVNQAFSSTVNETLLAAVQRAGDQAQGWASDAHASAAAEIADVQRDIQAVNASLDDALSSIAGWKQAVAGAQMALQGTAAQLPAIRAALGTASADLDALRSQTGDFQKVFSQSLIDTTTAVSTVSGRAASDVGKSAVDLQSVAAEVEGVKTQLESMTFTDPALAAKAEALVGSLDVASSLLSDAMAEANKSVSDMDAQVQETSKGIVEASSSFSTEVMPQLSNGAYDLSVALSGLSGSMSQFEPQVAQLQGVLTRTDEALDGAVSAINDAKALLASVSENLSATVADLGALGSALEIDAIAELLSIDPDKLGQFVSSPVNMVTEKVYPVSNYGTAVTPFYTNLALWIGCFILASLMKLEVNPAGFEGASARQRYFGRWLLFVALSLLQSQVICGVDILLGIDCANPAAFMVAGAACSFAYMNLIFALVITFRNVGKTLCILLLIMQVPGSSGMYPIQMMPEFFQFIHPILPFTYGIDAMREALSGMYGTRYAGDLAAILFVVPLALAIGLLLRPYLMNLLHLMDEEMGKTGFLAREEHGQESEGTRIRGLMRVLAGNERYRDDLEERAWRFNRTYPTLRRAGSIALFAIPFGFLAVMFVLDLLVGFNVDAKLFAFVIMLVVLLVIAFALVALEYVHRMIVEETRLMGDSLIDDELGEYMTLMDQADGVRQEAESEADAVAGMLSEEMLDVAPPLSDRAMAMISARDVALGKAAGAKPSARASEAGAGVAAKRRIGNPARDVFFTDMRLGLQSVVGVVVIILLAITPALYAWFNIAGSWDPYSNTGNLRVAVANNDEGYKGDITPLTINIGDTIVSQLRGNSSFNWTFVDEETAVAGVESGEYYAAIVIPATFSESMMTYLTGNAQYPGVVYYTNEKENPIAPIITQKGADSIQENIRTTFTQRVDEAGLTIAYDLLDYITNPNVSGYAARMGGHLDDAIHDMSNGSAELGQLSMLSGTVSDVVGAAGMAVDGLRTAGDSARSSLTSARSGAQSATSAFNSASTITEDAFSKNTLNVDRIIEVAQAALTLLQGAAEDAPAAFDLVLSGIDDLIADLRADTHEDHGALIASLQELRAKVAVAKEHAAEVPGHIQQTSADLDQSVADARAGIASARGFYEDSVKPLLSGLQSSLGSAADSTSSVVDGLASTLDGLSGSTDGLVSQLSMLADGLKNAGQKLNTAASSIADTKKRVAEALQSGNVKQMQEVLLGSDTAVLATRLAAPIHLEREAMYSVRNYGSSMAPFYTVLSLWVGALVMISTIRVHLSPERLEELRSRYAKVKPGHEFAGRYGLFGFIMLLQSLLVLLGDLLFLRIQCVDPVMFVLFGLFIGQVFCIIVYTLTELFGDVGKALCVILLIMQVAASGGTFPVEMMSPVFAQIADFLPFFHAMSLLQECVAGIEWLSIMRFVLYLLLVVGIMLLIGVVVRKPFRKMNDWFESQLEKTGYM